MARFDVYVNRRGTGYLLDVQADLITSLNTRVVVPLIALAEAPAAADRLNPVFKVQGVEVSMLSQFMAAVPTSELTEVVASLDGESDAVFSAIDFLHHGW
mgnify:CR=1 FL=1